MREKKSNGEDKEYKGLVRGYCDGLLKEVKSYCKARSRFMSLYTGKVITMSIESLDSSSLVIPDGEHAFLQVILKIVWRLDMSSSTICKTENKMLDIELHNTDSIVENKKKLIRDLKDFIKETSTRVVSLKRGDNEHKKMREDDYWTDKLLKAYLI